MDSKPGAAEKSAKDEGLVLPRVALLIDDPLELERLTVTLRGASYDVCAFPSHIDAVPALGELAPDCIIVQAGRQEDEVGLISAIRAGQGIDRAPVIALTSEASQDGGVRALRAGADLCLAAPCQDTELLTNIDAQLRLWRLQAELQRQLDLNQALLSKLRVDLRLGQQVQRSFLPPFQLRTANFVLEARFMPSGDLSGDYFDYRLITPERVAVFLADVSGHGVASALLAGRMKAFFDENFRRAHRPRLLLERLNRVLIELGDHYHIATAVFLHIDVVETILTYASAGHRTLYLLDTEAGTHTALPATGPALGMFEEFEVNESSMGFLPGRNRLAAYTDGLVEFKLPGGAWFTEDQFRDTVLLPRAGMPIEQYVESLLAGSHEMNQYRPWEDDLSLIVIDF
jgi:sigma-B regulation protein RsbU (phosphoserine phosphatase)